MRCPNCGTDNIDGAAFCDNCGKPLPAASASVMPTTPASPLQATMPAGAAGAILCPNCGTPAMPGEIFCSNCGTALPAAAAVPAPPAPVPPAPAPPIQQPGIMETAPVAPPAGPTMPVVPVGQPYLVVAASGKQLSIAGKAEVLVGRVDPVSGIFPDVDLTPYGGDEGGVSRRHIKITLAGNQYFVEDLNSTNHTWIGQTQVNPGTRVPLNNGDQLRLGKVLLNFFTG